MQLSFYAFIVFQHCFMHTLHIKQSWLSTKSTKRNIQNPQITVDADNFKRFAVSDSLGAKYTEIMLLISGFHECLLPEGVLQTVSFKPTSRFRSFVLNASENLWFFFFKNYNKNTEWNMRTFSWTRLAPSSVSTQPTSAASKRYYTVKSIQARSRETEREDRGGRSGSENVQ